MEIIKNVATGISISAVVLGAVYMLSPDGKNGKMLRYIAGLVMIIAVAAPFVGSSFSLEFSESQASVEISAEDMLKNQVEHIIAKLLRDEGIDFEFIRPYMDISPEGSISIYRIYVSGASDKEKVRQILGENFPECEVEV